MMAKSVRDIFFGFLVDELKVSHEILNRFDIYHDLLKTWQKKINLISDGTDIWTRHFLDSAQLAKFIPDKNLSILDIGSGAGFPSLVLSILGYKNITAVESDRKKCVFIKEAARATSTHISVENIRIEDIESSPRNIITARACADLKSLFELSFPFVSHGTTCLFLKGKKYAMELEEANKEWMFDYKVIPSITNNEGAILLISNLKRRA